MAKPGEAGLGEPVTLGEAFERALAGNPRLLALELEAEEAEGRIDHAGVRPNPVLGFEAENFLGSNEYRNRESVEVTLGIRQLVERGGKRERRIAVARAEREFVEIRRELMRAEILSEVRQVFTSALLAKESVDLRRDQLRLAERSEKETARQVEASRLSAAELHRATLATGQARFALNQAEREYAGFLEALGLLWGDSSGEISGIAGELEFREELPELEELSGLLSGTVFLGRFDQEREIREAEERLERAHAKMDVEFFAGGRFLNEGRGDVAFVAGIEIPLPVSDKNRGAIRSARARLEAVSHEREAAYRELLRGLAENYREMRAALQDLESVEKELLPAAEKSVSAMEAGFVQGVVSQLQLLESRRTWFEIREMRLAALNQYFRAENGIEAMIRPATVSK